MVDIVLSIKPHFAEKIFQGEKLFEYRRIFPRRSDIRAVFVYATKPVGEVIGQFLVAEIIQLPIRDLWRATHKHSGITETFFSSYFVGRSHGFAVSIVAPKRFDRPRKISEYGIKYPPQSFAYVKCASQLSSRPA